MLSDRGLRHKLPLRSQPNEVSIARAIEEIQANPHYLAAIPSRAEPYIPAHKAAQYTYGRCAAFAEAMRELTGLKPAALLIEFTVSTDEHRRVVEKIQQSSADVYEAALRDAIDVIQARR